MIWNRDTLAALRLLSTRASLGLEMDTKSARTAASDQLARAFMHEARERFGAEIHFADLSIDWSIEESPIPRARGVAMWGPKGRPARLAGGPADGRVVELYGSPSHGVNVNPGSLGMRDETPGPSAPAPPLTVRYRLAGWDDTSRVWVMRPE